MTYEKIYRFGTHEVNLTADWFLQFKQTVDLVKR
jgi:hypothetical protein